MRATLRATRGLRIATIVLIWAATAGTGFQFLGIVNQRSVWNDPSSSRIERVDAANAAGGAAVLYGLAALACLIVLSIWTLRSVGNAQRLGTQNLRPGLACGGWYIPLGNVFVPFIQLRRATAALGARTSRVTLWQVGWGLMVVGGFVGVSLETPDAADPDPYIDALSAQALGTGLVFLAAIVAAVGATLAMRTLDDAVTARSAA